ncbi:cell division protein ZapE [Porticoccaceae bacterium]|mgnify:CR=1 FL=1|jgi:cell division protein ZapE|nr:cell division protein ZapE [Porticoccaceae bacterium]
MTTPKQRYYDDLSREGFVADNAQKQAVDHLESLYHRLVAKHHKQQEISLFDRIKGLVVDPKVTPERGLYLWGGVGRGKTYLMDSFYESLPFDAKMRIHFHRFMRRVHADLRLYNGHANPLERVAEKISSETNIICFDEFFVSDITDAMILGTLFEALFTRGVSLVATSNIQPSGLYKNGLQRQRFLPAISLIEQHCQVINVDGGSDYRLRALANTSLYHSPLNDQADSAITRIFKSLTANDKSIVRQGEIKINDRVIPVVAMTSDVIWFDFLAICDGPRSQNDYIDIACEFHAVVVSNVPALNVEKEDCARRFINLVDEFYDRNVKLAISAELPLQKIYQGTKLSFEFERTQSRLIEMQSLEFLSQAHQVD